MYPVIRLTVVLLFTCACVANPADVTVIAWPLAWPAAKPTIRSVPVGVTDPELADVLVLEVPAETSRGLVGRTPENSSASSATAAAVVTVMVVTDAAFAAYHISPSET